MINSRFEQMIPEGISDCNTNISLTFFFFGTHVTPSQENEMTPGNVNDYKKKLLLVLIQMEEKEKENNNNKYDNFQDLVLRLCSYFLSLVP